MRYRVSLAWLLVLLLGAWIGCDNSSPTDPAIGEMHGEIRFVNVEGGCWGILGSDGVAYEPIHLPEDFRMDGLAVLVRLRERDDVGSTCMIGRMVEIVSIRRA